ncbi:hypothetical protein ACVWWK_002328 [Bradyrhizobium sp. LB9.1b]
MLGPGRLGSALAVGWLGNRLRRRRLGLGLGLGLGVRLGILRLVGRVRLLGDARLLATRLWGGLLVGIGRDRGDQGGTAVRVGPV